MGIPIDYAVRNLGRSPTRLLLSVIGAALVVLLVLAAAGFVRGINRSLTGSSENENVMFFSKGSEESIERSEISAAVPSLIQAGVRGIRTRLDVAYISPEMHMQSTVQITKDSVDNPQILVRGITPPAFLVHAGTRIIEGRSPESGRDEIAVGRLTYQRLGSTPLRAGAKLWFYNREWTVVGVMESPGSIIESEIWCPLADLQVAAKRLSNLSCVVITMGSGDFDDADAFARQNVTLELSAIRESDYYKKLSAIFSPVRTMVWITAILIATGGILGGLNTMYAAFASRVREVGALQAIGFSRRTIVKSLVQESLLAAMTGTLIAILLGLLFLDGITVQFSLGAFGLSIDPGVILLAAAAGIIVGLVGAIPPAIRCLRLPITEALKST